MNEPGSQAQALAMRKIMDMESILSIRFDSRNKLNASHLQSRKHNFKRTMDMSMLLKFINLEIRCKSACKSSCC